MAHPHKHLIKDLWPDKHLYASILLMIGAAMGAGYALVIAAIPVTYSPDMPDLLRGSNFTWSLVLSGVGLALAIGCYRSTSPTLGFFAAGAEVLSLGALGITPLLAVAATGFLVVARKEGEHENPATRRLAAHHWPDKALAAALLLFVSAIASLVWAYALLGGVLDVRGVDTQMWGLASLAAGVLALAAAALSYRQRAYWLCIAATVLVAVTGSFVVLGPALSIGSIALLVRARREDEFD